MHDAIASSHALKRAKELADQQRLRDDLAEIDQDTARVLNDRIIWRRGIDRFQIEGSDGAHDFVSAVAVLAGAGNPPPATPN